MSGRGSHRHGGSCGGKHPPSDPHGVDASHSHHDHAGHSHADHAAHAREQPLQRVRVKPEVMQTVPIDEFGPMLMLPVGLALRIA